MQRDIDMNLMVGQSNELHFLETKTQAIYDAMLAYWRKFYQAVPLDPVTEYPAFKYMVDRQGGTNTNVIYCNKMPDGIFSDAPANTTLKTFDGIWFRPFQNKYGENYLQQTTTFAQIDQTWELYTPFKNPYNTNSNIPAETVSNGHTFSWDLSFMQKMREFTKKDQYVMKVAIGAASVLNSTSQNFEPTQTDNLYQRCIEEISKIKTWATANNYNLNWRILIDQGEANNDSPVNLVEAAYNGIISGLRTEIGQTCDVVFRGTISVAGDNNAIQAQQNVAAADPNVYLYQIDETEISNTDPTNRFYFQIDSQVHPSSETLWKWGEEIFYEYGRFSAV